jgi:hypothetical protein
MGLGSVFFFFVRLLVLVFHLTTRPLVLFLGSRGPSLYPGFIPADRLV